MYENLKYNFDIEDWVVFRAAELRLAGKDPKTLVSRDIDGDWVIVGLTVNDEIVLAPEAVTALWMRRFGIGAVGRRRPSN